jgi:3-deoxy-D-manno-octulosonic-acid transferase
VRTLYLLASYLLTPVLLLYLCVRGLQGRGYLARWGERLGLHLPAVVPGGIIVHAVSVGEVNAAAPLISALLKRFPGQPLTVTCFTTTGSARIREVFGDAVQHLYFPLDLPGSARRFFTRLRPRLLIIMETEIWPNAYFEASRQGIPILLANARISDRTFKAYRRLQGLTRPALAQVRRIGAQTKTDAMRFEAIGAGSHQVEVTGNLKFDLSLAENLREQGRALRLRWGIERPVFLAGSTREGDEEAVLAAFQGLLHSFPDALLVWAPRHPQRFQRSAQLARAAGLTVQLHSEGSAIAPATHCLVVDAMGELLACYAACDVAFVGGSLATTGGHNVLEPAALSVPVLVGPHTQNFAEITRQLIAAGGALRVDDAMQLERAAARLLGDASLRQQMGAAGRALVQKGEGALARTLQIVFECLDEARRASDHSNS